MSFDSPNNTSTNAEKIDPPCGELSVSITTTAEKGTTLYCPAHKLGHAVTSNTTEVIFKSFCGGCTLNRQSGHADGRNRPDILGG